MHLAPRNRLAYPAEVAPGFDPTHVAAGGIPRVSVISTMGGGLINILTGARPATGGWLGNGVDGNLGPIGVTAPGYAYLFNSVLPSKGAITPLTFAGIIRPSSFATGGVCGIGDAYSSSVGFWSDGTPYFLRFGGNSTAFSGFAAVIGAPYFIVGSTDSATFTNIVLKRLDTGQVYSFVGPGQPCSTLASNGAAGLYTHGGNNSLGYSCPGSVSATMYSEVALSLSQMLAWAEDPWTFWYPRREPETFVGALIGGTQFPQSVAVACASAAATVRGARKQVAAACSGAISATRRTSKSVAATCVGAVSNIKRVGKAVAIACSSSTTAAGIRAILLTIAAACSSSVSFVKSPRKTIAATSTGAVSLIKAISKRIGISSALATVVSALSSSAGVTYTVNVAASCAAAVSSSAAAIAFVLWRAAAKARETWGAATKFAESWTKKSKTDENWTKE